MKIRLKVRYRKNSKEKYILEECDLNYSTFDTISKLLERTDIQELQVKINKQQDESK